jgi:hypothetical protein
MRSTRLPHRGPVTPWVSSLGGLRSGTWSRMRWPSAFKHHFELGQRRYFMRSLCSLGPLKGIEVSESLTTASDSDTHSRGLSQVAISRMTSRIGETHIPWTLEGSHLRVTSITAWVICYLQRIRYDMVGVNLLVQRWLVLEVRLHVLEELLHGVQLR